MNLFPVAEGKFESFRLGSGRTTRVEFEGNGQTLVLHASGDRYKATRVK